MVMPTPPPEGSSAPSVTAVTDVAEIGDDGAWLDRLIAMTSEREAVSRRLSVDTLLGIARPFSESAESKSPGSASLAIERLKLPAVFLQSYPGTVSRRRGRPLSTTHRQCES